MCKERLQYIDRLKGLAILLVVIGHLYVMNGQDGTLPVRTIYLFHMPLFFFLSGLVTNDLWDASWGGQLKHRSMRLVLPFMTWILIDALLIDTEIVGSILDFMKGGYWYLFVLFGFSIYMIVHCKLNHCLNLQDRWYVEVCLAFAFYILLKIGYRFISDEMNAITGYLHWICYLPMFFAGYMFKKHDLVKRLSYRKWVFIVCSILATGLSYMQLFMRIEIPFVPFILQYSIIQILLCVTYRLEKNNNSLLVGLSLIGRYSLSIYMMHYIILHYIHIRYMWSEIGDGLSFLACCVIAVIVSLTCVVFQMQTSRSRMLNLILFGENK